jgi:chromosome segregation ATPase
MTELISQEFLDAVNQKTKECEVLKKDLYIAERGAQLADEMTKKYLGEHAKSTKLAERLMEVENALDAMTDQVLKSKEKNQRVNQLLLETGNGLKASRERVELLEYNKEHDHVRNEKEVTKLKEQKRALVKKHLHLSFPNVRISQRVMELEKMLDEQKDKYVKKVSEMGAFNCQLEDEVRAVRLDNVRLEEELRVVKKQLKTVNKNYENLEAEKEELEETIQELEETSKYDEDGYEITTYTADDWDEWNEKCENLEDELEKSRAKCRRAEEELEHTKKKLKISKMIPSQTIELD